MNRKVNERRPRRPLQFAVVLMAMTAWAPSQVVPGAGTRIESEAHTGLDLAWRFATSIRDDEQSGGSAQRAVLDALVKSGRLDEALQRSHDVIGWQRGVAYADLAAALAMAGRREEAKAFIARAEGVRGTVTGWQNPRIAMHIGGALATLGEREQAAAILNRTAENDPGEYAGRAAATLATAALDGQGFEPAMATLAEEGTEDDFHNAWWRTRGYLDLAQREDLTREQRLRALEEARHHVDAAVGTRKIDLMKGIAAAYHGLGETKKARATLEIVEEWVVGSAAKSPTGAAQLAELARTWQEFGATKQAAALLSRAETAVLKGTVTERPTLYARVASGYRLIGNEEKAEALYGKALDAADLLPAARPRALSAVAVCLSLAGDGTPIEAGLRSRLEALLGGVQDL